ncbi:MAG TPA: hypothetical protein VGX78_04140, partial [Pirellulales bacterium]|nr:hypothetical protein [Pirellulales bacterium]
FSFAGVAPVVAQDEDLPPPRPAPRRGDRAVRPRGSDRAERPRADRTQDDRPSPGERLEKLRNIGGRLIEALGGDPAQQPKPLDVLKLNDGIVELLKPLFENEQTIESFKLGFDPEETNFAKDSAKLIASTRLKQSAWSSEASQLDLSIAARFQRGENNAPQARIEGQLAVQTDVIPLANHAVARFLKRNGAARGGASSPDEAFMAQVRERLSKTPPVSSMDELVDLIVGLAGLRLTTMNDRIVELARAERTEREDDARQRLTGELAQARLERDRLFDMRPRVERDADGKALAVFITKERPSTDGALHLERLAVAITADKITVDVGGTLVQGTEIYAVLKPLILDNLSRIQERDPATQRWGQGILGQYLRQGRDALDESE